MNEFIRTERLIIRRFRHEDYEDLYEYLSDEEVVKYEPYEVYTLEECEKEAINRSSNNSFLAVTLAKNGKLIGNIYFNKSEPDFVNTYELGYVFNPSFSKMGYATEAAFAIADYGFKELHAHRIIAMCNVVNENSWKLLERLNMRREATRIKNMYFDTNSEDQPNWFDSYQYGILDEEWFEINNNK